MDNLYTDSGYCAMSYARKAWMELNEYLNPYRIIKTKQRISTTGDIGEWETDTLSLRETKQRISANEYDAFEDDIVRRIDGALRPHAKTLEVHSRVLQLADGERFEVFVRVKRDNHKDQPHKPRFQVELEVGSKPIPDGDTLIKSDLHITFRALFPLDDVIDYDTTTHAFGLVRCLPDELKTLEFINLEREIFGEDYEPNPNGTRGIMHVRTPLEIEYKESK